MTTIYGIKNCDTVKKSLKWLEKNNIEFTFHDFRVDGLTPELLSSFVERSDWNVLLNKRSTTFRNLPAEIKDNLTDDVMFKAVLEQPTLLKRPILIRNDVTCVGFKDDLYQENLL
ncbi:ArsC family reductase [Pseudocolwellia sp. AS88]|uniref:ArsC family reductase n=1 Tax=Pseudocolwellia sp. AS88 TaxID=3063958 RepID=UPI0026F20549|nr:ArsC family reductase [Pseudocolwellia sp. AS88]MDO7084595.1 ArsC family reductase [Pseudocolwellia sp. AS88]